MQTKAPFGFVSHITQKCRVLKLAQVGSYQAVQAHSISAVFLEKGC